MGRQTNEYTPINKVAARQIIAAIEKLDKVIKEKEAPRSIIQIKSSGGTAIDFSSNSFQIQQGLIPNAGYIGIEIKKDSPVGNYVTNNFDNNLYGGKGNYIRIMVSPSNFKYGTEFQKYTDQELKDLAKAITRLTKVL